jgi:hypothetical protein
MVGGGYVCLSILTPNPMFSFVALDDVFDRMVRQLAPIFGGGVEGPFS